MRSEGVPVASQVLEQLRQIAQKLKVADCLDS
jgi:hypothetical protein